VLVLLSDPFVITRTLLLLESNEDAWGVSLRWMDQGGSPSSLSFEVI
jgi:hypothetical protein